VTLRIPPGFNAVSAVQLQVSSSDTNIAVPEGAVGGALTVTFRGRREHGNFQRRV